MPPPPTGSSCNLGDLIDHGPDSAAVLRDMFGLIDAGRGLFLLGNHEFKLARCWPASTCDRWVSARRRWPARRRLCARLLAEVARRAAVAVCGNAVFVHGGFHTAMLDALRRSSARAGRGRSWPARLYGEPTGRTQPDGYPERSLRWVDRIPAGITVYCGHDRRSPRRPAVVAAGAAGGRRCSSTPARARAGTCPGSISIRCRLVMVSVESGSVRTWRLGMILLLKVSDSSRSTFACAKR